MKMTPDMELRQALIGHIYEAAQELGVVPRNAPYQKATHIADLLLDDAITTLEPTDALVMAKVMGQSAIMSLRVRAQEERHANDS